MKRTTPAYTLKFSTVAMRVEHSGEEAAVDLYTLHRTRPENLVKETAVYTARNGRKFATGIVLNQRGHGLGVSWPV